MWKITYIINNHYRDNDNYPTCRNGEPESVEAETLDEAFEDLLKQLKDNNELNSIVETHAKNLTSYNDCYDIEIISVDEIKKSVEFDFHNYPSFVELVNARKKQVENHEKEKQKKESAAKKRKELSELKRLSKKYSGSTL